MIVRDRKYKQTVIDILSKSFDDNASINFIVKQDMHRKMRIRKLMNYCFEVCLDRGMILLTKDRHACALVLNSDSKISWFKSLRLDISLALEAIGLTRIFEVIKREKLIKGNQPKSEFYYLWFIGVDPMEQGKGVGTELLKEVLQRCDEVQRPVYLETSVLKNLPWYERFGFRIFSEIDIGYKLFQMIRD